MQDLAGDAIFDHREQDLGRAVRRQPGHRDVYQVYTRYTRVYVVYTRYTGRQRDLAVRVRRSALRRRDDAVPVRPEHVDAAVHHRLWRVDARAVARLPLGELRG